MSGAGNRLVARLQVVRPHPQTKRLGGKMKTIRIKDYYGIYQEIPVSDELYEEWRALQNETQRVHRKEVYHRDWTPIETFSKCRSLMSRTDGRYVAVG